MVSVGAFPGVAVAVSEPAHRGLGLGDVAGALGALVPAPPRPAGWAAVPPRCHPARLLARESFTYAAWWPGGLAARRGAAERGLEWLAA